MINMFLTTNQKNATTHQKRHHFSAPARTAPRQELLAVLLGVKPFHHIFHPLVPPTSVLRPAAENVVSLSLQ